MFSFQRVKDGLRDIGVGMTVAGMLGLIFNDTATGTAVLAVVLGLAFFTLGVHKDDEVSDD